MHHGNMGEYPRSPLSQARLPARRTLTRCRTSDLEHALTNPTEGQDQIVRQVIESYLESGDFNGLTIRGALPEGWDARALAGAIRADLIEVITQADFMNVHVRPWPSRLSAEGQVIAALAAAGPGSGEVVCLYPTAASVSGRALPEYEGRPYSEAMARGRGCLELVYFEMPVIETYMRDPRYHFSFDDFGATWGIGDDAYLDDKQPEADKINTVKAGFAYDSAALSQADIAIRRYVCAFYTDLARLSERHQKRMQSWQVPDDALSPHPTWYGMQMGRWADSLGPFEKILAELEAINDCWQIVYGKPLFLVTERPRGWGWVLRPTTGDWGTFIHETDKLLSDNLNKHALDAASAPTSNGQGQSLGTLGRLEEFLVQNCKVTPENARHVMEPLRVVRKVRQKPAHDLAGTLSDQEVLIRQRDLLRDVAYTLMGIREFMQAHPKVESAGWQPQGYLTDPWMLL